MLQILTEYREATRLIGWYEHKRAERIAKIQPIAIKEYHEKCNSRRYTELERASFELEFPEFSDFWTVYKVMDEKIIIIDKAIEMLNKIIKNCEFKINRDFINFFNQGD